MAYDPQLNFTLILITMITTVVMMIIGSSIALSLRLVGALSIIRFRTPIKNPIDAAFIFWTIATGLGLGAFNYWLAFIQTAIIMIAVSMLGSFWAAVAINREYMIMLNIKPGFLDTSELEATLKSSTLSFEVRPVVTSDQDVEHSVFARMNENSITKLTNELRQIGSVSSVSVIHPNTNIYL